ncbi:helix-turn-helix domain-containing protein [Curtobacterium sp. VKM Ac-2865]|uniref:helix-turn-helix transcriptional regulator n=1 Tax=Curtobacterium sp. VKM Ac-2865 TaxID=2783817 RepID=UPI00188BB889|nr:helix-turn-helix transcriptional regulator [Curtobacterium sp. VKM Ac-2865]MBF4582200.1 helix-turn-helix domain-containing protein [Curtobacterium sp. VKM Ac-2865]
MNDMRIAELRRHRGWTQERLAEESGVTARTVQRLESGADGSLETVSQIARALGVPVRELFTADPAEQVDVGVRGLDERTLAEQARRDSYTRGWRYLYLGVGLLVTFAVIGALSARAVPGLLVFVIPAYWAGGTLLSRFLMMVVLDPWLDRRYPLSSSRLRA